MINRKCWLFIVVFYIFCILIMKAGYCEDIEEKHDDSDGQSFHEFLENLGIGELTDEDIRNGLQKTGEFSWRVQKKTILKSILNIQNIQYILQGVTVFRVLENGEVKGYYMKKVEKGSIAQMAGFKKNDLIMRINDSSVDDFLQVENLNGLLIGEKEVRVSMEREGKVITQIYRIED